MSFRVVNGSSFTEDGWRCVNRDECGLVQIPGLTFVDTAPIRRGEPLTILGAWMFWYDRNVEEIVSPVWGWSESNDVLGGYGRNNGSNHLGGTAIDVNAPKYPWGRLVMPKDRVAKIEEGLRLFSPTGRIEDSVVFWGRVWNRPDEMHYQMRFPEGDRRNIDFANKLLGGYLGIYGAGGPTVETLTAEMVLAKAAGISVSKATEILPTLRQGLLLAGCGTPKRIAMFIAQTCHESDHYNATEEYANGPMNDERWIFKGRTWIQITWRSHYEEFGKWCVAQGLIDDPDLFVNDPRALANVRWAGVGAAWYWVNTVRESRRYHTLNEASDAGDILTATQIVNGGTNGLKERTEIYNRAMALGDQLLKITGNGIDTLEELLMANLALPSWSIYSTPGEPDVPVLDMIRAIDAKEHRDAVEDDAFEGDIDAIQRIGRTAAGLGRVRTPYAISRATKKLNELYALHPEWIEAATPGKKV